jgi:hypothetical protein
MGAEVEKQIDDTKFKITILDLISELAKRRVIFQELYNKTKSETYNRILVWIDTRITELRDLL